MVDGHCGWSSGSGSGSSPAYVARVLGKKKRLTPRSAAMRNSSTDALALTCQAVGGSASEERVNSDAMCRMHSGRTSSRSFAIRALSVMSACSKRTPGTTGGSRSMPVTSLPAACRRSTSRRARLPAAPVTR